MYRILEQRPLCGNILGLRLLAPDLAKAVQPGQFALLRLRPTDPRTPVALCDWDREAGTVTVLWEVSGSDILSPETALPQEAVADLVGPMGSPMDLGGIRQAAIVGGGLGCALLYPFAKALRQQGAQVHSILGFRTRSLMVLEAEYAAVSQKLSIVTDDGSYGEKALVTDLLRAQLDAGMTYDRVFAVGPLTMVKFVSLLTLPYGIPTVVSLNPLLDRFFGEAAPSGRVLPEIFGSTGPTAAPSPQPVSGPHKKCNLFP